MIQTIKRKFLGLSIHCLLKHYRALCEALETVWERWCGQRPSDADTILKHLLSFEFLASAVNLKIDTFYASHKWSLFFFNIVCIINAKIQLAWLYLTNLIDLKPSLKCIFLKQKDCYFNNTCLLPGMYYISF